MIDAPASGPAADAGRAGQGSWSALGRLLLADLLGVLRERFHLLALEGRQFVHAAGALLALGVAAALLVLTAWFIVVAALVALCVHLGLPMAAALVLGAAANLGAAWLAWLGMRRQLSLMTFAATLQTLKVDRARAPAPAGDTGPMPSATTAAGVRELPPDANPRTAAAADAERAATAAVRDDPLDPAPH